MEQDNIDDVLRQIADEYALPEKKGELLTVLKLLKETIIKNQISITENALQTLKSRFERDNIIHLNQDNNEKIKELKAKYGL